MAESTLQQEDLMGSDFIKPLVVYGLKRLWIDDGTRKKGGHAIIFSCILPGALITMKSDIYLVFKNSLAASMSMARDNDPDGYELTHDWERRAKREGEMLHHIALALQKTEGLGWLYILRTGFVAMGREHMAERAPAIMEKMRTVLVEVCGDIEFVEVPEHELFIPDLRSVQAAKELGVLLPNGFVQGLQVA